MCIARQSGLVIALIAGSAVASAANGPDPSAFFESRVRPLLVAKCQGCHGGKIAEAGLRLDSRPALLAGSIACDRRLRRV